MINIIKQIVGIPRTPKTNIFSSSQDKIFRKIKVNHSQNMMQTDKIQRIIWYF